MLHQHLILCNFSSDVTCQHFHDYVTNKRYNRLVLRLAASSIGLTPVLASIGLCLHCRSVHGLHPVHQRPEGQQELRLVHRTGPRPFQCLIPTLPIRHLPSDCSLRDETDPILMRQLYRTIPFPILGNLSSPDAPLIPADSPRNVFIQLIISQGYHLSGIIVRALSKATAVFVES